MTDDGYHRGCVKYIRLVSDLAMVVISMDVDDLSTRIVPKCIGELTCVFISYVLVNLTIILYLPVQVELCPQLCESHPK